MSFLPTSDLEQYLNIAKQAAYRGGEVLKKYWGNLNDIQYKTNTSDLVTEADKESEKAIVSFMEEQLPHHSILAEEGGLVSSQEKDFLWAIDPLDGTTNYTHQYPMVCVSIGLLYKGIPQLGVIFNPIFGELFTGARNLGASLSFEETNTPLSISSVQDLEKALLVTGFAYDRRENKNNNYPEFCALTQHSQGVRRSGSAALDLAYLATGRVDAYWERGLKVWDLAAGIVLVEEAGGKVSSYDGQPLNLLVPPQQDIRILASNGHLHSKMIQTLLKIAQEKQNPNV